MSYNVEQSSNNPNLGAIQFSDTEYTSSNQFAITSIPIQIPNNKGSVLNLSAPNIGTDWINNLGEITPDNGDGDSYLLRITMNVDPATNNRTVSCFIDIGLPNPILETSKRLQVNASTDKPIELLLKFYCLNTFLANNGSIMISIDGLGTIYDISYLLQKTKKVANF